MEGVLDSECPCKNLDFAELEDLADNVSVILVNAVCKLVLIVSNPIIPLGMSEV